MSKSRDSMRLLRRRASTGVRGARALLGRSKHTWYEANVMHARRLTVSEVATLVFGQQTAGTVGWFQQLLGQAHTIPITRFPHFLSLSENDRDPTETTYSEYLRRNWKYLKRRSPGEDIAQQVRAFRAFHTAIHHRGCIDEPLYVCERPDGLFLLIDGNHRAAIALYEGLEVEARFVDPSALLAARTQHPKVFYGSGHRGLPYQSLYQDGLKVIAGRRVDMLERMALVDGSDIRSRHVLDLGANIGGNCLLAAEAGAMKVTAVEVEPDLVTAAARINAYFAAPLHHVLHDLRTPLRLEEPADTTFCFAVLDHVRAADVLLHSIARNTREVMYFEGHPGQDPDELQLLLRSVSAKVELIGYCRDGIHSTASTRPFFRCEMKA